MKKSIIAILLVAIVAISATQAMAKDVILDEKIGKIVYKQDKDGNDYARTFIQEVRTLKGIEYTASVSVMFFGEAVKALKAANVSEGDQVKMIAQVNDYNGNPSYNVLTMLQ